MTPGAEVCDLAPLVVSRREVLRNLGYPRARRPSDRVAETLDRLWQPALELMTPRGILRLVDAHEAAGTGMPRPTEIVGLGICTAGPGLEREEQRLGDVGQLLEALILDAFGSAAAEAAADALNLRICVLAQARGYQLPPRISPGYGQWDIRGQRTLLGLLGAEAIDIRLTEGLMMVPRKSVSFAVRFSRDFEPGRTNQRRCASCDLKSCAFRLPPEEDET